MTALGVAGALDELGVLRLPDWLRSALVENGKGLGGHCLERLARHGDFGFFWETIEKLPRGAVRQLVCNTAAPQLFVDGTLADREQVETQLKKLGPWKKGPFSIRFESPERSNGELFIDSEWCSDEKWQRLARFDVGFAGARVLDVGTGNGYYLLRLAGERARDVVGVEPGVRSIAQFLALSRLTGTLPITLLPLPFEDLKWRESPFDVVMSMGVIYHRRNPRLHLEELRSALREGGTLVLESIVIPSSEGALLAPESRYASMRNVFAVPSPGRLEQWVREAGFVDIRTSEPRLTSVREQRTTPFADTPSLHEFLEPTSGDPDDPSRRTIEGHPRPCRQIVVAKKPTRGGGRARTVDPGGG